MAEAELVSERFENWTNRVDVEPLTEHMMMAMQSPFQELTDQPNFTFTQNPGVVGASPDADPNYKHSQGSATAAVGNTPTLRELGDLPAGSTLMRSGTGSSDTQIRTTGTTPRSGQSPDRGRSENGRSTSCRWLRRP